MFWKSIQRNFVGFFLLVLAFGTTVTHAQTGTTSLRGTVTDKSGGAIVGAKAVLRSSEKALTGEIHTSNTGAHEFSALPPDNYILTIEATGFRKYEHSKIELLVNAPATENVTLEVGANTETVEVSAQATALNTADASLGNVFNETQDPNNGTIVSAFSNGSAAQSSFVEPFPGQAGQRNNLRGPGFFGFDTGLSKRWTMPWGEGQSLQFSLSVLMP